MLNQNLLVNRHLNLDQILRVFRVAFLLEVYLNLLVSHHLNLCLEVDLNLLVAHVQSRYPNLLVTLNRKDLLDPLVEVSLSHLVMLPAELQVKHLVEVSILVLLLMLHRRVEFLVTILQTRLMLRHREVFLDHQVNRHLLVPVNLLQ